MTAEYDAIIIGTGIGGSVAGALLAHAGRKILILEKNDITGGRCTSYERDGFTIDLGMHNYFPPDISVTTEVLHQIGMPNAIEWINMRDFGRAILQFGDKKVAYSWKTMAELVPEKERDTLLNILTKGVFLPDKEIDALWDVPVAEWVNKFTTDPMIHLFVDNLMSQVFCVSYSKASTAEWIKIIKDRSRSQMRGVYYPKGGNISISNAFISAIKKYGGDVLLNAPVKKILIEDGSTVGVRLKDDREFQAPVIISNADIKSTVRDLAGEAHFPADYVKRIRDLTYSAAGVTLKVLLEEKVIDEWMVIYMPDIDHPTYNVAKDMEKGKIPEWVGAVSFITSNVDPDLAPPGKQCVSFVVACPAGQNWKEWEKVLLNNFYRVHPQAKNKVMRYWLENSNWLDARVGKGGSIIGVGQMLGQVHENRPSVTTPVKGLYFSSADVGKYQVGVELAASAAKELFGVLTR